jgi:hypothetical protein
MLKITYTLTGDHERMSQVLILLREIGDPFRVPLELPELHGKWLATRIGHKGGGIEGGYFQGLAHLVIELEEYRSV